VVVVCVLSAYRVISDFPDGSARKGQTVWLRPARAARFLASRHIVTQPDAEPLARMRERMNAAVKQRRCCF